MYFWEKIEKPYKFLAPMVNNSELAWRTLSRRYGADFCVTEMVHCDVFLRSKRDPLKNRWYTTNKEDRPLVIQICGNDANTMLETSKLLQDYCDAIDINFGCPQEIARKGKYGSFLQDDWDRMYEIINTLSSNLKVPITSKIRIFDCVEKSVKYAKMIESAGCKLLTVHGRTREQRGINSGLASWKHIKAIKENLKIPVIANGNIVYGGDISKCLEYTKCDGVMVGETHLYNPLIFSDSKKNILEIFGEYLEICKSIENSYTATNLKSHSFKLLYNFFKFYPELRDDLNKCFLLDEYFSFYEKLKEFVQKNNIQENYLKLGSYIRNRYIDVLENN